MGINQGNLVSDFPDLTVDVGDAGLIYVDSSNRVGIGVSDPDSELEVLATTTQLKLSYDANSFISFTVADDSHTTIATGESGYISVVDAFAANTGGTFGTFSDGDATPSVATGNLWKHHASSQTITMFDDGIAGQTICVISTAAITYDVTSTNLKGGSADITTASGDVTWWTFDGTNWYLAQYMDADGDFTTVGDITGVTAGTGLSGGGTSGAVTLNVEASQTQITAVGTIGTGTWQGTAIASAYLDADTAHLSGIQTFSGAKTFSGGITSTAAANTLGATEITQGASGGAALFTLDNDDTDQIAMKIEAANIDADVIEMTADALTTSTAINISTDGLTTGNIMKLVSDSSSTATRTLVEMVNDNTAATDTVVLKLKNDAITPGGTLVVESSANDPNPTVEILNTYNAADRPPILQFTKVGGVADDYDIGKLSFVGENNAGTPEPIEYAQILVEASDTVDGDEGGQITISVMAGGTAGTAALTEALKIGREDASEAAGHALMLNDTNADLNVKMRSVNNNNMFLLDAGTDRIGVGKSVPTSTLHIKGSFCKEVTNQTTGTLAITESHNVITCDTSGGNVECDLPAISSITGRIYTFIKTHASNSMIIDPNLSEKIYKAASPSGGATITYGDIGSTVTLQCTSIGWVVLSEYVPT